MLTDDAVGKGGKEPAEECNAVSGGICEDGMILLMYSEVVIWYDECGGLGCTYSTETMFVSIE